MMDGSQYMLRAIELARRGLYTTAPNPRVGCVIVKEQEIVGEGWHQKAGEPHAEVLALSAAGEKAKDATLYVTMEPCAHHGRTPPCCDAIIEAGIKKVVCATLDPSAKNNGKGVRYLSDHGIEVDTDLHAEMAAELNPGFFSLSLHGRPWIRIKLAISLDGRTALESGESAWISGDEARRDVQFWRARSDAMLTGCGTVVYDTPQMNVRLSSAELEIEDEVRQPLRIVVDSQLKTSPDAMIYQSAGQAIIASCSDDEVRITEFERNNVEVWRFTAHNGQVPLDQLCQKLAEHEVAEIQVEAGERLVGSLIMNHLYDELLLYIAPALLGDGKALARISGLDTMKERQNLVWQDISQIGEDLRVIVRPRNKLHWQSS